MLNNLPSLLLSISCAVVFGHGCNPPQTESSSQVTPQTTASAGPVRSEQPPAFESKINVTGRTIWTGESGGFGIQWTTDDLFVRSAGRTERIWAPLAEQGFREFTADIARIGEPGEKSTKGCDYRRDYVVLSVVGPLISFQDDEYSDCGGAHPTTYRRFTMINLERPGGVLYGRGDHVMDADLSSGKIVKLTDFFDEQEVLRALLADRVIQQALSDANISIHPKTLAELPELFAGDEYTLSGTELELRPDFLTRFAFHHIEGDKVAVRLNLSSIGFADRAQQIGLLLPIPPALQQSLASAATEQQGMLMKDSARIARNKFTRFRFSPGKASRPAK